MVNAFLIRNRFAIMGITPLDRFTIANKGYFCFYIDIFLFIFIVGFHPLQCDPNNYIDGLNSNLGLIQSSQETTLNSTFLPIGADDGGNSTANSISKIMEIADLNERKKALNKLTFGDDDDDEDKDDKTNKKKTIDKNQTDEINSSRFEILSDKTDQVGK